MEQQLELFPIEKKKRVWVDQLKLFPEYESQFRVRRFKDMLRKMDLEKKANIDKELLVLVEKFIDDIHKVMQK